MEHSPVAPRFYTDFDGVFGAGYASLLWLSAASGDVIDAHGNRTQITWAPDLVTAIDQLRAEYGVELVWLTSWCEDDDIGLRVVPVLHGLRDGRTLRHTVDDGSGEWKLRAILADQAASPSPFIWADDVEARAHGEELLDAGSHLLLAPDTSMGLGPRHLTRMREWLAVNAAGAGRRA